MHKETIFAILLGVVGGAGVAVFMIMNLHNTQLKKEKPITIARISPTVTVKNTDYQPLQVQQPQNDAIVTTNSVTIKGKSVKNSLMVIQSPIKNLIVQNDKEDFSVNFPLALGENALHIAVYPKDTTIAPQEKDLKIYYLDEQ